jgi:hypothetical protein
MVNDLRTLIDLIGEEEWSQHLGLTFIHAIPRIVDLLHLTSPITLLNYPLQSN